MPELARTGPLGDVAQKGASIYAAHKGEFEEKYKGKFLAIEVDSEKVYDGNDGASALEKSRAAHPGKMFYVVRVGYDSAETLSHLLLKRR